MKTGIILLCRFSSRRLPGKILKSIQGKTILEHIMEKLRQVGVPVVVATSVDASDDVIADYCLSRGWSLYRGSLENVAERFLLCAEKFSFDYAVRINGDNLFADSALISEMVKVASKGEFDLVSNVKGRTFPVGMSIEIVRVSKFRELFQSFEMHQFEHVTLYFYENEDQLNIHFVYNEHHPEAKGLHLAIDTPDDFERASRILSRAKDMSKIGIGTIHRFSVQE